MVQVAGRTLPSKLKQRDTGKCGVFLEYFCIEPSGICLLFSKASMWGKWSVRKLHHRNASMQMHTHTLGADAKIFICFGMYLQYDAFFYQT